ncbi:MAG: flagellar export chaperone FliS [Actinomycetota bacterium]|nr:flagellar export chaperone FliS [Actinomycetota bacterium]
MNPNVRSAYMNNSVSTANPQRLLVMLYDRLLLDVQRGLGAQRAADHAAAYPHLIHAQDIVAELRATLRVDDWEGGPGLASLYDWLLTQLVRANVQRDPSITVECLPVIESLVQAWHEAAGLPATA